MTLADLPEVGLRAPWRTDREWRDMLMHSLPGRRVWIDSLHVDRALGELSAASLPPRPLRAPPRRHPPRAARDGIRDRRRATDRQPSHGYELKSPVKYMSPAQKTSSHRRRGRGIDRASCPTVASSSARRTHSHCGAKGSAVPPRPSEDMCVVIGESLRRTHSATRTHRELAAQLPWLTVGLVRQEAKAQRIILSRGRATGTKMPDGWGFGRGGGRPTGTLKSDNRLIAFGLFEQGQRPSDVVAVLGISRTRANIFHREYLEMKDKPMTD